MTYRDLSASPAAEADFGQFLAELHALDGATTLVAYGDFGGRRCAVVSHVAMLTEFEIATHLEPHL